MANDRRERVRGRHPHAHSRVARALGADDDLPIDPDLEDAAELRARHRPTRSTAAVALAAVFAGAFLGTVARYGVETAWPTHGGHFPTATFVINTSGAFVLGLVLTALLERAPYRSRWLGTHPHASAHVRAFVGGGLLGGWTTYSTMVVEAVTLGHDGRLSAGAGYLALSLVCGVSASVAGIGLGRVRTPRATARLGRAADRPDRREAR